VVGEGVGWWGGGLFLRGWGRVLFFTSLSIFFALLGYSTRPLSPQKRPSYVQEHALLAC